MLKSQTTDGFVLLPNDHRLCATTVKRFLFHLSSHTRRNGINPTKHVFFFFSPSLLPPIHNMAQKYKNKNKEGGGKKSQAISDVLTAQEGFLHRSLKKITTTQPIIEQLPPRCVSRSHYISLLSHQMRAIGRPARHTDAMQQKMVLHHAPFAPLPSTLPA